MQLNQGLDVGRNKVVQRPFPAFCPSVRRKRPLERIYSGLPPLLIQ